PRGDDALALGARRRPVLAGGRTVGVDLDVSLTGLPPLVELGERDQALRGVDPGVTREARVRRVDAPRVRARVPLIDRRVVLDARVGAAPRRLGDLRHDVAGAQRLDRLAGGAGDRLPLAVGLDGAHELLGDADRVV